MGFVTPTLSSVLWLPVGAVLFLLPGQLFARRLACPAPWLAGFLASAVYLFNLAVLFSAIGVPLEFRTVAAGLTLATLGAWKLPQRTLARRPLSFLPRSGDWLWLLPPFFALLSVSVRAVIDPLSGYDNGFRWDYLARLILAHASMGGYPPVSAADFEFYAWCDGIPPLVPLINFWIYATADSIAPSLIAMRVIGEAVLLGYAIHRYASLLWGERGGASALAAVSASSLAIWSIATGQETGLTAISLVAMLYYLELAKREPAAHGVRWAAVAAGVGALSREYTLIYFCLGAGVLLSRRVPLRSLAEFSAIATAIAAPWYVRNWITTGNPLYPQTLGGIFPGNSVHEEVMRYVTENWSPLNGRIDPTYLAIYLGPVAAVTALFGLVGAAKRRPGTLPALLGVVTVTGLWAASLRHTDGGWNYAARILLPALAVLAVLSGWIGEARARIRYLLLSVLSLAAIDASRRAWMLPTTAMSSPANFSFQPWRDMRDTLRQIGNERVWAILAHEAGTSGIVVDHPANHALVTMQGGTAVPFFSPALRPAFDDTLPFETALRQLQDSKIRFVVLTPVSPVTEKLVRAHPFWSTLVSRFEPASTVGLLTIFDLSHLSRRSALQGSATPAAPP